MLTYENLVFSANERIPEVKEYYDALVKKDVIDSKSGNHIVFGYVYVPVLTDAIKSDKTELVKNMFSFLEEMASSDDGHIVEVCDQSVLEALNDEFDDKLLFPLMGENTKVGFAALKSYMY